MKDEKEKEEVAHQTKIFGAAHAHTVIHFARNFVSVYTHTRLFKSAIF